MKYIKFFIITILFITNIESAATDKKLNIHLVKTTGNRVLPLAESKDYAYQTLFLTKLLLQSSKNYNHVSVERSELIDKCYGLKRELLAHRIRKIFIDFMQDLLMLSLIDTTCLKDGISYKLKTTPNTVVYGQSQEELINLYSVIIPKIVNHYGSLIKNNSILLDEKIKINIVIPSITFYIHLASEISNLTDSDIKKYNLSKDIIEEAKKSSKKHFSLLSKYITFDIKIGDNFIEELNRGIGIRFDELEDINWKEAKKCNTVPCCDMKSLHKSYLPSTHVICKGSVLNPMDALSTRLELSGSTAKQIAIFYIHDNRWVSIIAIKKSLDKFEYYVIDPLNQISLTDETLNSLLI